MAHGLNSWHMNLTNYILFTCELSWKASKAASYAGIGLVSLSPSALLWPFLLLLLLLLVLAAGGGRRAEGPPPALLLPAHRETWQTYWRSKNQSYSTWRQCKCIAQPGCIQRIQQVCFHSFIFNYNPANCCVTDFSSTKTRTTTLKKKFFPGHSASLLNVSDTALLARRFYKSDLLLNIHFMVDCCILCIHKYPPSHNIFTIVMKNPCNNMR